MQTTASRPQGGAVHARQIFPFKKNLTFGWFDEPQDGASQSGFSAAAFSYQAESLSAFETKADAVDGPDIFMRASENSMPDGEVNFELRDGQHGRGLAQEQLRGGISEPQAFGRQMESFRVAPPPTLQGQTIHIAIPFVAEIVAGDLAELFERPTGNHS